MAKPPKSKHALFPITIPSTGIKYNFRRFLTAEEKILLTAQASNDKSDIVNAVEQIINNCAGDPEFQVDSLTTFDFDYVFIKLRAASVDNSVQVKYTDPDNDEQHTFLINLDDVQVQMPDIPRKIVNDDGVTTVLRYPTMREMLDLLANMRNPQEGMLSYLDQLLVLCVESIYNEEEQFEFDDKDLLEFIDDQATEVFGKIKLFLNNIPDVSHTVDYINEEGEQKQLVLKGIEDFFTF